jgi:hypothetical protein
MMNRVIAHDVHWHASIPLALDQIQHASLIHVASPW